MSNRSFKTSAILASIHSFPMIVAARENGSITECFDKLREVSPKIAGIKYPTDHMAWCSLSRALSPALKDVFSDLASEKVPDLDYWSNVKTIDNGKKANLGEWVKRMENKYGTTLEVPDIHDTVRQNLEPST